MTIARILVNSSPEDARSSLYYAARYIKQAGSFDSYEKDIFEDEQHNAPSDLVRKLTLRLIEAIELSEGKSAGQFDDETVIRLLDEITSLEASIPSDLSDAELERGVSLAAGMLPPTSMLPDD
ncbi:hypothetical protein [Paracoccus xiamenensis]|uniref:hypothetical protein n=1 Tax=Paracoccus xiamenensis TaxID=2714901 RepID=UPI0014099E21|nr:hypothetical protein [Paracoccus xiamenensis]NHF74746.1 hypothetical protein [Paracoccus xiamenensis]